MVLTLNSISNFTSSFMSKQVVILRNEEDQGLTQISVEGSQGSSNDSSSDEGSQDSSDDSSNNKKTPKGKMPKSMY